MPVCSKKDFFETKADHWHKKEADADKIFLESFFSSYVNRLTGNILDLACGTGVLFPFIIERMDSGGRLIAIDLSFSMLKYAKESYTHKFEPLRVDAHFLPFYPGSFSTIFCFNSFPHFDEKIRVLEELYSMLSPGGKLYVFHSMNHRQLNEMHQAHHAVASDIMPPAKGLKRELLSIGFVDVFAREKEDEYIVISTR